MSNRSPQYKIETDLVIVETHSKTDAESIVASLFAQHHEYEGLQRSSRITLLDSAFQLLQTSEERPEETQEVDGVSITYWLI